MRFYAYSCPPIDCGWHRMQSVRDVVLKLAREYSDSEDPTAYGPTSALMEFLEDWKAARKQAMGIGWDGEFSEGPCVFYMPTEDEGWQWGFAIKQFDNGATFLLSPSPLAEFAQYMVQDPTGHDAAAPSR